MRSRAFRARPILRKKRRPIRRDRVSFRARTGPVAWPRREGTTAVTENRLLAPVVSITPTQRGRFFWAAWWTAAPSQSPFRKPDASNGGAATLDDAREEAARIASAGRSVQTLTEIDPRWARGWQRTLRGMPPFTERDARALGGVPPAASRPPGPKPSNASAWEVLGLQPGADAAHVKQAYRRRALETHPDHGGDPAAFRALHAAYLRALERAASPSQSGRRRR